MSIEEFMEEKKLFVRRLENPDFFSEKYVGKYLMMGHTKIATQLPVRFFIGEVKSLSSSKDIDLYLKGFSLVNDREKKNITRQIILGIEYVPESPSYEYPLTDLINYDKFVFYEFEKKLNIEGIINMVEEGTGRLVIEKN